MARPSTRTLAIAALASAGLLASAALALGWAERRAAERSLAAAARLLAPLGRLSWGGSFAEPGGRAGARDLVLVGRFGRAEAASLSLDPGGRWAALRLALSREQGPPPALRLVVRRLRLPAPAAAPAALGLESFDVVPCGGLDGAAVLAALRAAAGDGGAARGADLELAWRYDGDARRLLVEGALVADGLVAARLALEVEALDAAPRLADLADARPIARRGELVVEERGWYAASAATCAARSGLDAAAWRAAHAAAVAELLAADGLAPSGSLIEGWRGFRAAPRGWRVAFDNAALHGAAALLARAPTEIPALIGLEVEFNGAPVAEPTLAPLAAQRWPAAPPLADAPAAVDALLEPTVRSLFGPVPASPAAGPTPAPRARPKALPPGATVLPGATTLTPRDAPPPDGRDLRWDALRGARGARVWVVMRDGRTLAGTLQDANPWRLTLEQRIHGGRVVMPLARDAVARVVVER